MSYITVGKENSGNIDLYCEDHARGSRLSSFTDIQ
jgi:hypothetical protein